MWLAIVAGLASWLAWIERPRLGHDLGPWLPVVHGAALGTVIAGIARREGRSPRWVGVFSVGCAVAPTLVAFGRVLDFHFDSPRRAYQLRLSDLSFDAADAFGILQFGVLVTLVSVMFYALLARVDDDRGGEWGLDLAAPLLLLGTTSCLPRASVLLVAFGSIGAWLACVVLLRQARERVLARLAFVVATLAAAWSMDRALAGEIYIGFSMAADGVWIRLIADSPERVIREDRSIAYAALLGVFALAWRLLRAVRTPALPVERRRLLLESFTPLVIAGAASGVVHARLQRALAVETRAQRELVARSSSSPRGFCHRFLRDLGALSSWDGSSLRPLLPARVSDQPPLLVVAGDLPFARMLASPVSSFELFTTHEAPPTSVIHGLFGDPGAELSSCATRIGEWPSTEPRVRAWCRALGPTRMECTLDASTWILELIEQDHRALVPGLSGLEALRWTEGQASALVGDGELWVAARGDLDMQAVGRWVYASSSFLGVHDAELVLVPMDPKASAFFTRPTQPIGMLRIGALPLSLAPRIYDAVLHGLHACGKLFPKGRLPMTWTVPKGFAEPLYPVNLAPDALDECLRHEVPYPKTGPNDFRLPLRLEVER